MAANPAKIIERIRANGANVMVDGRKLEIVNRHKLPAGALDYIKAHGREIADLLCREAEFEERAAIIEYDGGAPRAVAEAFAKLCIGRMTEGWSELDRSWAISVCGRIIDGVADVQPERRAA